jgi:eukaryotic-like serine/threonine-protein kinase
LNGRLGKYELLDELGAGGMAVVYRARDTLLQRTVALKVINQRLHSGENAKRRFLNEARVAAALSHPNIISIYELGVEDGFPFIAMEYLPGRDLRDLIDERQPLEARHKVSIALQIARALEHAHSRGVIHRDVKPANIRILESGVVKLMDFGIAKFLEEETSRLTRTGAVVGSTPYLSPEQLQGEEPSEASDAFAFGIVLYELLSYTRPFNASNPAATVYRILHVEAPPITDEHVPERLTRLVEACLKKEPAERMASFPRIVEELRAIRNELAPGSNGDPFDEALRRAPAAEAEAVPADPTSQVAVAQRSRTDSTALRLMRWVRLRREDSEEHDSPLRIVLIGSLVFVLGALSVVVLALGAAYVAGMLTRGQWAQRTPTPLGRATEAASPPALAAMRRASETPTAGPSHPPTPPPLSPRPSTPPSPPPSRTPTKGPSWTATPRPSWSATPRPTLTPTSEPSTTPTRSPTQAPTPTAVPSATRPPASPTVPPTAAPSPGVAEARLGLEQSKPRGNELEYYEKAKSQAEKGRWADAAESLRKAIGENPEPGYLLEGMFPVKYLPQLLLAEAYLNLGDLDLARRYLREAKRYRLEPSETSELEKRLRP